MNKNNVNISKKILQSMTAAVCAWTILLGLVAPGMAAETEVPAIQESVLLETTAKTTAEAVTEEDNSGTTQYLLATLRGEIAEYMEIYQISPEMPDSALANAYFTLDSAEAKAAWDTAHTLMEKAAELSDEDTAALMADINTKLCLRFYGIMAQINNPAMAAEYTTISGLTITDTGSNAEVSTNSLKASVAGSKDSCGNDKEASRTITLKNSSGSVGTLSFDWEVNGNASSFTITKSDGSTITATSGTGFSDDLAADASVTITFKAKGSGNTATLSLTSVKLMAAASDSNITFQYDTEYGSVQQGSISVNNGETVSIESHTEFSAVPANGAKFVAWLDSSNKVLGVNSTLLVEASGDQSIYALFVHPTKSNAWFDPGNGYLYSDWDTAFANGSVVAIACDGLLPTESHTVVSGKTLLIPYNNANTVITTNMEDYDILPADAGAQTLYRQLIMPSGASITVQDGGSLNVGSRASRQMTGQVGAYGAIKMDSGSSITIASGATLYAWGYLFHGDNGSGTVTIENGGIVYETLMSMDYPGSASTTNTLYNDGIFPLRTFTVRNVEVPMTLEYGAEEQCFFHFYGTNWLVGDNPGYVSLIGNDSTFTFQMENGTEIVKSYTNSRQKFSVNGSASLNAIAITVKSTDITSTQTSGFPVPSGYDIEIASGTFKLNENVILMEGSTLTIANGAFADTNGKNVYIFDADDDAGSVSATDVHSVAYTLVAEDAIIDINGTLNVSGGFYTSEHNACITSSGGTGTINITSASSKSKVKIKTSLNTSKEYDVNPAQLKNADGKNPVYTDTSGTAATYVYRNGIWCPHTDTSYTDSNNDHKCDTCGTVMSQCYDDVDDGDHHCDICGADGITEHTMVNGVCTECGAAYEAQIGSTYCGTLAEALDQVAEGATVTLLTNISGEITISQQVSIELGNYNANIQAGEGFTYAKNGTVITIGKAVLGIGAVNLRAGDSLDLFFYVKKTALANSGYTDFYAKIERTKGGTVQPAETISYAQWEDYNETYVRFCYDGIAAKEMTDSVTVTVYSADGKPLSSAYTDSVQGYAMRMIRKGSSSAALKTALVDMLNYGAAAQTHFGFNTSSLANALIESEGYSSLATKETPVCTKITGNPDTFYAGSVSVKNNLTFTFCFSGIDPDKIATATYTDHYGKNKTPSGTFYTLTDENGVTVTNGGQTVYGVDIEDIAIADGRQKITCTVTDVSGNEIQAISSVESYLAYAMEKYPDEDVFPMLAKFIDSAYAYFHQ